MIKRSLLNEQWLRRLCNNVSWNINQQSLDRLDRHKLRTTSFNHKGCSQHFFVGRLQNCINKSPFCPHLCGSDINRLCRWIMRKGVAGAAPGASLTLYRKRASDADFAKIADATARADGTFDWTIKPPESTLFRVDQAAGQTWEAASAETMTAGTPVEKPKLAAGMFVGIGVAVSNAYPATPATVKVRVYTAPKALS